MNEFFNKTVNPKTAQEYTNIVLRIKRALELNENDDNMFVIDRFDDIKRYFETLSLPTVQKYSMVLRKLVPMLLLKQETEDEYVRLYLNISARAKTPNHVQNQTVHPHVSSIVQKRYLSLQSYC